MTSRRVLLVEDEPDIRFLVRATIERLTDWELVEAEHAPRAPGWPARCSPTSSSST